MSKPNKRPSKPSKAASPAAKDSGSKPTDSKRKAEANPETKAGMGGSLRVIKVDPSEVAALMESMNEAERETAKQGSNKQPAGTPAAPLADAERSAAWRKEESRHQDQLMYIMFDLMAEYRTAKGAWAEYFDLLMKVMGGRPHDDRMWPFILACHNSVQDEDLALEDGLNILRQIHQHNSLYDPKSAAG